MDRSKYDEDIQNGLAWLTTMHEFQLSMRKIEQLQPYSHEEFDELQRKIEYMVYEADVQQHASDPLDTPLQVNIQSFTMQRLQRVVKERGESIDALVNSVISMWLYDVGE